MLNMLLVTPTITMMKILMRCVHYECALLMIPFPLLHNENRPAQPNEKCLGAVHILHQPKSGVPGPPPPIVSNGQHLADAPFVLQFLCRLVYMIR